MAVFDDLGESGVLKGVVEVMASNFLLLIIVVVCLGVGEEGEEVGVVSAVGGFVEGFVVWDEEGQAVRIDFSREVRGRYNSTFEDRSYPSFLSSSTVFYFSSFSMSLCVC